MKTNKIALIPIRPQQDGLMALASVEIDDNFYIGSIGVYKKRDGSGYRITFPTRKVGNRNVTICHPTTPELSKEIERAITIKAEEILGL